MTPRKLTLLSAFVALLFGFIVLFERKMPSTAERERKGDLYWDIPVENVQRLELKRAGEILEFVRVDPSRWTMVRPWKYPADAFAVSGVASELAALKRAGGDAAEARPADYGLDKPVATATLVWTDPEDPKARKTRTVEFGAGIPGTDIVSSRLSATQKVLFVPTSVLTSLQKSVDEFQSKDVFGGSSADVARIEILRGGGRLALVRKAGAWWLAEPFADLADSGEIDRLAGQLSSLRAREFVRGGVDLAAQGLAPPLFRVTVTDPKGVATSVDFGATRSDGSAIYAQREGQVLAVDKEILDDLSREAVAFRSPQLVEFNRIDVAALEGRFGKTSFALAQKDGGWSAEGRPILAGAIDDLESAILGLESRGFLDPGETKALAAPVATVTVRMKVGPPWAVSLHPHATGAAATVSSRPGGFRVDAASASQLEAAFRKTALAPTPSGTKGR